MNNQQACAWTQQPCGGAEDQQRPDVPPSLTIGQCEVARLLELQGPAREYDRLRRSIVERLKAGADTEQGRYTVRVDLRYSRRFSRQVLEQFWGKEYVQQLQASLPQSASHHLHVTDQTQLTEI